MSLFWKTPIAVRPGKNAYSQLSKFKRTIHTLEPKEDAAYLTSKVSPKSNMIPKRSHSTLSVSTQHYAAILSKI